MRITQFFIILAMHSLILNAQEPDFNPAVFQGNPKATLYIRLVDSLNKLVTYHDCWIMEKGQNRRIDGITDKKGIATFPVMKGKTYILNFADKLNHSEIEIPANEYSSVSRTIMYHPPITDGSEKLIPDTVIQNNVLGKAPDPGKVMLKIILVTRDNKPIPDFTVRLFDPKIKRYYITSTDKRGNALFMVNPDSRFAVGIDIFENYTEIESTGFSSGMIIEFTPTKINETIINDTVRQELTAYAKPTSLRALVKLVITDHDGKPLANENVYLDQMGIKRVYHAKTDARGIAQFLLPKGESYLLCFTYERNMRQFDFPVDPSLSTVTLRTNYIGTKKVEEYYHTTYVKRAFRTEFMNPKIEIARFDRAIVEKTRNGYNLNFPSTSPISTPTVFGNKMVVSSGYYNPEIYCLDRKTAVSKWGAKLAESGPSSFVYSEGMILVNTESCTLYCINAETGILAWSKWLGPYLYTTPSVHGENVFTTYPVDLERSDADSSFVMVAFDIKTGNIVWQNWMSAEALAAPVIANGAVFVTDLKGHLYKFNEKDGKQEAMVPAFAVSPPTVAGGFVFVNVKKNLLNQCVPSVFEELGLKPVVEVKEIGIPIPFMVPHDLSAFRLMSFNDGRTSCYKNKNYLFAGNELICYKPNDGKLLWKISPGNIIEGSVPVVLPGFILVSTRDGKIQLYDTESGKQAYTFTLNYTPFADAIAVDGWIYSGTTEGKVVAINTGNLKINGWNNWGGNAQHNPVVQ